MFLTYKVTPLFYCPTLGVDVSSNSTPSIVFNMLRVINLTADSIICSLDTLICDAE